MADTPAKKTTSTSPVKPRKTKKRAKVAGGKGRAYITATYNNTIITITDENGDTLAWSSAGHMGFKGPKKSTPYAAGIVVRDVMEKLQNAGLSELQVFVRGVGSGREAAVRALNAQGLNLSAIRDVTPIPHNGPRAKKPRRV